MSRADNFLPAERVSQAGSLSGIEKKDQDSVSVNEDEKKVDSFLVKAWEILKQDRGEEKVDDFEIEEKAKLLKQAYRYFYGGEQRLVRPEEVSPIQWQKVIQLAEEIESVNRMDWKLVDNGQNMRAKRPDGSEVTVPANYFDKSSRCLDLNYVVVDKRAGYNIHDALKVIVLGSHRGAKDDRR